MQKTAPLIILSESNLAWTRNSRHHEAFLAKQNGAKSLQNECLVQNECFLSNNAYEDISRGVGCFPDSVLVKTSTDSHRWPDEKMLRQSKFLEPVHFLDDLVLRMASAFLGLGKRASITAVDLIQWKKLDSGIFTNLI